MGVGVARSAGAGPDTKEAYRRTGSIGPSGPYRLSESSANTVAAQKVASMASPKGAKGEAAPHRLRAECPWSWKGGGVCEDR